MSEETIRAAAAILEARYGPYPDESSLPVTDQLVWFSLSTRTTVENCDAAYAALRARFRDWEEVADAPPETLAEPLRPAGLQRARAANLSASLAAVRRRFGSTSLEALRGLDYGEAESFLLSLPGVGLKVARCVMAFGLGRRVFAVDAHIWRVARRLGWHGFPGDAPTKRGADRIQSLVPEDVDAVSFHVNLIRLGREFCPAGTPRCGACPLGGLCPSRGEARHRQASAI
jgi:endonuclease-3